MASPAPSTNSAANAPTKQQEQITFRFCRECSNMLYPKEDRVTNKLMFACRTCQFTEEAQSSCVFRNNMYNTVGETAGVTQDVGSDPTVGGPTSDVSHLSEEDLTCTYCGRELEEEFVELSVGEQDEEMAVKEPEIKISNFDLSEMSHMEEEDLDMDGESDNGMMDEPDEGEESLDRGVERTNSRKSS